MQTESCHKTDGSGPKLKLLPTGQCRVLVNVKARGYFKSLWLTDHDLYSNGTTLELPTLSYCEHVSQTQAFRAEHRIIEGPELEGLRVMVLTPSCGWDKVNFLSNSWSGALSGFTKKMILCCCFSCCRAMLTEPRTFRLLVLPCQ